jgi:hypothetical protein
MAIATKYRRRISVKGRNFLWYVREDDDEFYLPTLHVISEDKRFIVAYLLNQCDTTRHLVVKGHEFPGLPEAGHCWKRALCPRWEIGSTITPASVRQLIEWCFDPDRHLTLVDWTGKPKKIEDGSSLSPLRINDTL